MSSRLNLSTGRKDPSTSPPSIYLVGKFFADVHIYMVIGPPNEIHKPRRDYTLAALDFVEGEPFDKLRVKI